MNADATIEEAEGFVRRIVENERGKCGGSVPVAITRASALYGIDRNTLRSFWERRARKFVKAHDYLHLKQIEAWIRQCADRERELLEQTAATLERVNHPLAGIARRAAEMAGKEK